MWIKCFVFLAVAQGVVDGYRHKAINHLDDNYSDEDLYSDLDSWNGRDDKFDSPASNAISAAEQSLAAAKAFVQAKKYARQALAAAKQAAKAAALAGDNSRMAAHIASKAASRSADHLAKVPGIPSTSRGKRPIGGGRRLGSAAGSNTNLSRGNSRPTISGTPTASPKLSSSSTDELLTDSAHGGSKSQSLNVILRFPSFHYSSSLSRRSSKTAVILKHRMIQAMKNVFKKGQLLKCEIKSFKRGGLLVDFSLTLASSVKNPLQLIRNAVKKGYFARIPVQKTPFKVYNVKPPSSGSKPGAKGCTPCKNLAPGVKIVSQKQCPTGYCATLMVNPAQVMQAAAGAAAAPAPAPAPPFSAYPQPAMAPAQPSYSSCPQMCQAPAAQYSCLPACPLSCCTIGKK